jgi:hypothetical protein
MNFACFNTTSSNSINQIVPNLNKTCRISVKPVHSALTRQKQYLHYNLYQKKEMHEVIKSTDTNSGKTKILANKTSSSATLSTTNPKQNGLGLKSGISGEWPVMAQPDMKSAVHTGTTVT